MKKTLIVSALLALLAVPAFAQDSLGDFSIDSPADKESTSPTTRSLGSTKVDPAMKADSSSSTMGNLAEQKGEKTYGKEEAKGLVKEELELVQLLLQMKHQEQAIIHVEKAAEIAEGNDALKTSLEGLVKDLRGGSAENAHTRINEILSGL